MCILFKLVIFIMHAGNIFLFEHLYFGKFFAQHMEIFCLLAPSYFVHLTTLLIK